MENSTGVSIEIRPLTVELNQEQVVTGDCVIIRTSTHADTQESVFGHCTSRFHPLATESNYPSPIGCCAPAALREGCFWILDLMKLFP